MKKNLSSLTIIITLMVIVSKLLALLREVVLAYYYGTSVTADAYTLTQSIVTTFESVFAAFTLAFLPIYQQHKQKNLLEKNQFLNSVYSNITFIAIGTTVLCIFSGTNIFECITPGMPSETYSMAVEIFKILSISIPLFFIASMLGQHLRGEDSYIIPIAVTIPAHIAVIVGFIFISPYYGINGVAFCFVLGIIIQVLLQYFALNKKGYNYHFYLDFHNYGFRSLVIMTTPMIISGSIENITSTVNKLFAANLAAGSISALNYANKVSLVVISLLASGPVTLYYAKMSELSAINKKNELKTLYISNTNLTNLIVVPLTFGMIALRVPIIELVFERGAFATTSTEETASIFAAYSIGLTGHSIRIITSRLYYSLSNQKTPLFNGLFIILMCFLLCSVLIQPFGSAGIALASSVANILGATFLLIQLKREFAGFHIRSILLPLILYCISGVIMYLCIYYVYTFISGKISSDILLLIYITIIGAAIYFTMIYFINRLKRRVSTILKK